MADFISAIAGGLAALLELFFYCLVFLARQAVALISYTCSKAYRERKKAEWGNQHFRKVLALSFSGLCLIGLISFGVWAAMALGRENGSDSPAKQTQTKLQFEFHAKGKDGKNLKVAIKDGGVSNMIAAQSLNDLAKKIKENIIVVGETNQATNYSIEFRASATEK